MKWLLSLHTSGKLSTAGERIELLLLSTVNGQRLDNLPTSGWGLSPRTGKSLMEIDVLES